MNRTRKAWINGLFLVITLIINTLGSIGLINGLSQKQISDRYPTLITPGPATFSIWGIIYSLLLIAVIAMIVKKDDAYYKNAVDRITVLFRLSCILNAVWIIAFSYDLIELSALFIIGFVVSLSLVCQKLLAIQDRKRWLLPLSFGFYTGWLLIASVVNIAAALVKMKWNGFGIPESNWAIIILIVAVFLVVAVMAKNHNAAFPLPIAWAYFGIYQFLASPEGYKGQYGLLQTIALIGIIVLIGVAAIQLYRNHFSLLPGAPEKKPASPES